MCAVNLMFCVGNQKFIKVLKKSDHLENNSLSSDCKHTGIQNVHFFYKYFLDRLHWVAVSYSRGEADGNR